MKRYPDCQFDSSRCPSCSLSSYGRDCRNNPSNPISYRRRLLGMTQQDLSKKSLVKISTIQKLESGHNSILGARSSVIYQLCRALDCLMEELIEEATDSQ